MKEYEGYNVDFRFEDGVLLVHLSGKFPNEMLNEGKNLFLPLVDACLAQKCKQALVDARDLQVDFDTMALFQAGKDAAFLTRVGLRIALLAREDMIDPVFKDVASNRGAEIGVFTDIDTARAWLQT